ncbi:MAG TPA: hypothetical protein QF555_01920 [Candidatus Thalassarchaeaceae archaeon]|jgi:hypothetical protein|nr:hypothetical protein [Candidatus Thalassarchaeaceae archaeon]
MVDIFRLLGLPSPTSSSSQKGSEQSEIPSSSGPTTVPSPDSTEFLDLSSVQWAKKAGAITPDRHLRYIQPDDRHTIPHSEISERLREGDVVIVDLRRLAHMDAQKSACRRRIQEIANDLSIHAFVLDSSEDLILVPGVGISVDVDRHILGIETDLI